LDIFLVSVVLYVLGLASASRGMFQGEQGGCLFFFFGFEVFTTKWNQ